MSPSGRLAAVVSGTVIAVAVFVLHGGSPAAAGEDPQTTTTAGTSPVDERLTELEQRKLEEEIRSLELESQRAELDSDKLRKEIEQLRLSNEDSRAWWHGPLQMLPFLTAAIALIGLMVTFWKQSSDLTKQRRDEVAQRRSDTRQRFDESFAATVQNLGSESEGLQASGASALGAYLRPEHAEFHLPVFNLLVANVKLQHSKVVSSLLVQEFEKALRVVLSIKGAERPSSLDLSDANLLRVQLDGLSLEGVALDLGHARLNGASLVGTTLKRMRGYGVHLNGARLTDANLWEARLNGAVAARAQFHRAILKSATLKGAALQRAQFQEARLQSAHLEEADLIDARFEKADLNDTYFLRARLNDTALRSVIKAYNWDRAHFDRDVRDRLEARVKREAVHLS